MEVHVDFDRAEEKFFLSFSRQLTAGEITRLKELGFKKSSDRMAIGYTTNHTLSETWFAPNHPAYERYLDRLQDALDKGATLEEIPIEPSYEASEAQLVHDNYSYITFLLEGENEDWVVFEPFKRLATVIAQEFGNKRFGDALKGMTVSPRKGRSRSRILMAQGRVIGAATPLETTTHFSEKTAPETFHDYSDFESAVARQLRLQGDLSPSEAKELLKLPEHQTALKRQFDAADEPDESLAKNVAGQILKQSAKDGENVRERLEELGFTIPFAAREAYEQEKQVIELVNRYGLLYEYLEESFEKPFREQQQSVDKELSQLKGKRGKAIIQKRKDLQASLEPLAQGYRLATSLVEDEYVVFHQELQALIIERINALGFELEEEHREAVLSDIAEGLTDGRMAEGYALEPFPKVLDELIALHFSEGEGDNPEEKGEEKAGIRYYKRDEYPLYTHTIDALTHIKEGDVDSFVFEVPPFIAGEKYYKGFKAEILITHQENGRLHWEILADGSKLTEKGAREPAISRDKTSELFFLELPKTDEKEDNWKILYAQPLTQAFGEIRLPIAWAAIMTDRQPELLAEYEISQEEFEKGKQPDEPSSQQPAWMLTQLEYQQQKAIEKTGSTYVLNAQDKRDHEALVRKALEEGKPVPERVRKDYPWLEDELREAKWKIKMVSVQITAQQMKENFPQFSKGKTFYTWERANDYIGKLKAEGHPYAYYYVWFGDSMSLEGQMDLELLSFTRLNDYLLDFHTQISQGKIKAMDTDWSIGQSKELLEEYDLLNSRLDQLSETSNSTSASLTKSELEPEEHYSPHADRSNDYIYQDYQEFEDDLIYHVEELGDMTTTEAGGILMIPEHKQYAIQRFGLSQTPKPFLAYQVAGKIVERLTMSGTSLNDAHLDVELVDQFFDWFNSENRGKLDYQQLKALIRQWLQRPEVRPHEPTQDLIDTLEVTWLHTYVDEYLGPGGVYTPESAGMRYTKFHLLMPKGIIYWFYVHVVEGEDGLFRGSHESKKEFGEVSSSGGNPNINSKTYKTYEGAVCYAIHEGIEYIRHLLSLSKSENETDKLTRVLGVAKIAFSKYNCTSRKKRPQPASEPSAEKELLAKKKDKEKDSSEAQLESNSNPRIVDLTDKNGNPIPNVLAPAGVEEPFISSVIASVPKAIEGLSGLKKLKDESLLEQASPEELFTLTQLTGVHNEIPGLEVTKAGLWKVWEVRGQELFEHWGWPTDHNYPYLSLQSGYKDIQVLKAILDQGPVGKENWYNVAKHHRPIGDLEKALGILDFEMRTYTRLMLQSTNPKTKEPFAGKEQEYESYSGTLADLLSSKRLIEDYLEGQKSSKEKPAIQTSEEIDQTEVNLITNSSQDESLITSLGKSPEEYLSDFGLLHGEGKIKEASQILQHFLFDFQQGNHLEYLPELLKRMEYKGIKALLNKEGYQDFNRLINEEDFLTHLQVNLWSLIPEEFKKPKQIVKINWQADPADKGLQRIVGAFTGTDTYQVAQMGVLFDEHGIVATNGKRLIFLNEVSPAPKGLYCISKECFDHIGVEGDEEHSLSPVEEGRVEKFRLTKGYPEYQKVIPNSPENVVQPDLLSLQCFLQALLRSKLLNAVTHSIVLKWASQYGVVNAKQLQGALATMQRLGFKEVEMTWEGDPKPILITPRGESGLAPKLETHFVMLGPRRDFNISNSTQLPRGYLYYDLNTNMVITQGIGESMPVFRLNTSKKDTEKVANAIEAPADSTAKENLGLQDNFKPWTLTLEEIYEKGREPEFRKALFDFATTNDDREFYVIFHFVGSVSTRRNLFKSIEFETSLLPRDFNATHDSLTPPKGTPHPTRIQDYFFDSDRRIKAHHSAAGWIVPAEEQAKYGSGIDYWKLGHRTLLEWALRNHKEVPQKVLQEYPDLLKTTASQNENSSTKQGYQKNNQQVQNTPEYLDKVVAYMHDFYYERKRATKKQIETLAEELQVPNMGLMWEAVELSWMLWYQMIYREKTPFEDRLDKMIQFWNKLQPTYAYSDSSKEIYKQYSTPCPIGAIIAEYTRMSSASRIFEPSAGNGLLVLGADPKKTYVNEIDPSRLKSLEFQGFASITSLNATQPFPKEWTKYFDVMVTNPPFTKWEEGDWDKEYIIRQYFHNQIGLAKYIRLEHLMAGLALHTLKDGGRAAIIIMGHIYFDEEGYFARYRPFFNWLYRHYQVDDVINLNSFKLYNKQGAVAKTMLILISGRKPKPSGVAPRQGEAPYQETMVNSFEELWQRVKTHLQFEPPEYTVPILIQQLQIELEHDIL